jgi:hypothetical protein
MLVSTALGQDHDKRGQDRRDDDEAGSDLQEVLAAFGHDGDALCQRPPHGDYVGLIYAACQHPPYADGAVVSRLIVVWLTPKVRAMLDRYSGRSGDFVLVAAGSTSVANG